MNSNLSLEKFDLLSIVLVSILIISGLINIYSTTYLSDSEMYSIANPFGKQLLFILFSTVIFWVILLFKGKFFQQYSSLIYLFMIVSLILVLFFGNEIKGASSWFSFFGFSFQPSEFMKPVTALVLSKFLSNIHSDLKKIKVQLFSFIIIFIPISLIILQPDPGTALIYFSFFFVLYVVGLPSIYMNVFVVSVLLFLITILFKKNDILIVISILTGLLGLIFLYRKIKIGRLLFLSISSIIFVIFIDIIYNNIFEQRHRDRFEVVLGITEDNRGIGYNTNQSQLAFISGGFSGEGFLNGSQTKGDFVPEQHSDYIFATIGEEWGFLGTFSIILIYSLLIIRMINRANKNRNIFNKIFIYSIASIFFFQFSINVSMVIGVFPTVGIPLPFISYGGSSMVSSILLFAGYIKFDSYKKEKW
tara:strand:+ start:13436 stop:14689 length:1254 start_codon:yes stop_codon:yes gene_type:complete